MAGKAAPVEIVVPGLFGPLPGVDPGQRFPFLDRLLGRARRGDAPLQRDTTRTLFDLCGMPLAPDDEPATGAIAALGLELPAELRAWMFADPVYLKADQDRLMLFDQTHFELGDADCMAFKEAFNQHFSDRDIRLHIARRRHWFVSMPTPMRVRSHALEEVSGRSIEQFMPKGRDAGACRQLLNEIQMLFHGLEINQRRAEQGQLPVSGLWLHGFGELPNANSVKPRARRAIGADPVLRGIATLVEGHHAEVQHDPLTAGDLLVWDAIMPSVLDADPRAWVQSVERFSRWLEPQVSSALRKQSFHIHPADGSVYRFTPGMRKRFWRRGWRLVEHLASS